MNKDREYHIVTVELPTQSFINVLDWLIENYDRPTGERYFIRWPRIYFVDSKDHLMFLLRWGK
jgi:hypothetical protein